MLRNIICSCKVCDSSTSIAVANSATRQKNNLQPLLAQRAPPYKNTFDFSVLYFHSERHHTNTRFIFQSIIYTMSATIQKHVRFLSSLLPQRRHHTNTRFIFQSIIYTVSATIQKHVRFLSPLLPQRAPPYKYTFHFSIHYLHSERRHTKTR